jgi:hypothetical protein
MSDSRSEADKLCSSLNTSKAAKAHTRTMTGKMWIGKTDYREHIYWSTATIKSATTPMHMDLLGTAVIQLCGSKFWVVLEGADMDTIEGLNDFNSFLACVKDRIVEGVVLEAGDFLYVLFHSLLLHLMSS